MNDTVQTAQDSAVGSGAVVIAAAQQIFSTQTLDNTYKFRPDKEGKKRAPLTLSYPVLDAEGIAELLAEGTEKGKQYIQELIAAPITAYIKSLLVEDNEYNQEKLDAYLAKQPITIDFLANQPRAERSGATKEDFEAFANYYRQIMGLVQSTDGTTPFDQKKVDLAADIFAQRLKPVQAKPKMLTKMQAYLEQFKSAVDEDTATQLEAPIKYFEAKFEELLNAEITEDAI